MNENWPFKYIYYLLYSFKLTKQFDISNDVSTDPCNTSRLNVLYVGLRADSKLSNIYQLYKSTKLNIDMNITANK